jgi:hypothetical protein
MERMRSRVQLACQVGEGIEIVSAEENAAMAAGRANGMGRRGNGHGI